ncbi:nucleotidyl transferase AbiEii/AbiGii toxin family protein [[Pseudomonas] carboxydohydrogena]|uniref:Nucleotidyl transferase AbiEii/AbiGii toxin family protein n=1 Tax=Afipia carboxydohydrogena TaxID=290 RepID=A0ABY8BSW8_AFICR|nr:nucleotidyl transferase AbiEii/AbiGii toxin family protein [[Pseudomonas] carboxydohydrogena]WEF51974.1 nucleotidyl transferase AbiEii/AbiGii toxin family protein [[Pseudomonas] carboxydohydrogena]
MSTRDYIALIGASPRDRLGAFLATANRLGAPVGNIEKDFWVCWTLDALYHQLPHGQPRLLFKGGTSLSKAYGLIDRFSEDIDVTVFRDDLEQATSVEELEALSNKKRRAKLDAIRDACRAYITGPLRAALTEIATEATSGAGRVEVDDTDPDGQTLLIHYPEVEPRDGAYVRPVVRIESGAKSALDPNAAAIVRPYVADEIEGLDLAVSDVTTIEAERTFWDKVVIAHGLRRWFDRRGALRQEGQRISRHYYDLHRLVASQPGRLALADDALGEDCVRHARMFFDRPDYDLKSARRGTYALVPHDAMTHALRNDYENTKAMIFGAPPTFDDILASIAKLEAELNGQ